MRALIVSLLSGLATAGWAPVEEADWQWVLRSLNPDADEASLPLVGRNFLGQAERLVMSLPKATPGEQWVVRLWDSGVRLDDEAVRCVHPGASMIQGRERVMATWKAIFEDFPTASIGDIALDQSNPDILWVGTGEAKLLFYESSAYEPWVVGEKRATQPIDSLTIRVLPPDNLRLRDAGRHLAQGAEAADVGQALAQPVGLLYHIAVIRPPGAEQRSDVCFVKFISQRAGFYYSTDCNGYPVATGLMRAQRNFYLGHMR